MENSHAREKRPQVIGTSQNNAGDVPAGSADTHPDLLFGENGRLLRARQLSSLRRKTAVSSATSEAVSTPITCVGLALVGDGYPVSRGRLRRGPDDGRLALELELVDFGVERDQQVVVGRQPRRQRLRILLRPLPEHDHRPRSGTTLSNRPRRRRRTADEPKRVVDLVELSQVDGGGGAPR